ncbi:ElyC/SanA/YdcF family protein [uncultured Dokdonia sp.]|uniref:SanA/YdcF family protein n=1 Tax=uncultured Dokdonia sp. TaxID=575653 RepID=UPI002628D936|nr:ElyC/SanA/YdcF family protein [uncultured Dokdonia sp.]
MRKKIKSLVLLIAITLLIIVVSNYSIESYASDKTFSAVSDIKKNKVGLVLGTSKLLQNGRTNLYFTYRIEATVALYKEDKIDFVLVSGDNSTELYDEPTDFKEELIKRGIPEHKIFLDYAGFRTLDSVIRAKEIFGQEEITIISQEFHNERAIYLAGKNDIKAVGFNARDVSRRYGLKVQLREYLARTKVFFDILFGVKPKFLGEKIEIK